MLEFLKIEYSQTGELDSSLEFFPSPHRGQLIGWKRRTAWKHFNKKLHPWPLKQRYSPPASMEKAKRVNDVMVKSVMHCDIIICWDNFQPEHLCVKDNSFFSP